MKKTLEYKQKNRSFTVKGNEPIDKILYTLEYSSVLSDNVKGKISNTCMGVLLWESQGDTVAKSAGNITNNIVELMEDLEFCSIFSASFLKMLRFEFFKGLAFEFSKHPDKQALSSDNLFMIM